VLEELELRRAIEELLPYVNVEEARAELRRMVADPRFHGRQSGELRVVLASWGSGPVALEQISREYRAWCAAAHRTNCHQGPLTDSSIYEIAFDFAMGAQWDGFVGEVKSTIAPSTIRLVLLTGLVIFMATIAIPELVSKIPAAAATMILTAYLGARAVCDLIFGWIQMVRELDAATTFNEVRTAGQRYGQLVGAQTAKILILLATAAIAQGGLIARLMKLPRVTQASAALAAETGGVGLEAVGAVKEVRILQGGMAITVEGAATGAVGVAMAANGPVPGWQSEPATASANREDLSKAAGAPDKGDLTVAGRSLTKHGIGARPGNSKFPQATGTPSQINRQAQAIVDDILSNPRTTYTKSFRGRFGDTLEVMAPDGRGIVYDANGRFLFFME